MVRLNQVGFLRFILDDKFVKSFQHLGASFTFKNPYGTTTTTTITTVPSDKIGTIQRRLAWPLTHKSRNGTTTGENNSCSKEGPTPSRLALQGKLERALKERQVHEAWQTYKDFKRLYGYPNQIIMANLITELSYSPDSKCIRKASDLVVLISKEKPVLLGQDTMSKLALSLARAEIPVPTSTILRIMLGKRRLPSLDVLRMIFLHLVKKDVGTYLASSLLVEICESFLLLKEKRSLQIELTLPDATIFNLVLGACVKFGSSLKAQQIMELMPQVGVVADAHTVVIISCIHEMNGTRDELKKFKDYIYAVPATLLSHYQQFYECLLGLHFKFNDIDAASALLLEICGYRDSFPAQVGPREQLKAYSVSIGSDHIKTGLRLQFLPQKLHKDSVYKVEGKQELLVYKNGKFVLSNKGLAKLVVGCKKNGKINELSKLLMSMQPMFSLAENKSSCSDVVDACIYLGWLETAHDIIEDLESGKHSVREGCYASLLTAYHSKKMFKEAEALVRDMRRVDLTTNLSIEDICSAEQEMTSDLDERTSPCKSDLAESIIRYMREEDRVVSRMFHEYNSSIYYFTKAKMMEDALRTYRKMQEMKIQPTTSTFYYMICGYSSLGMYREITILWGDIKRTMGNQKLKYNRDLYELLLINFIRGGYFERVMEVIGFMMENGMFMDKWCYKNEFLKFHRDLYRCLTATEAKNEAQSRRIEYVQAFRKFVGIV